jgi:transcription elongation factor SPT6
MTLQYQKHVPREPTLEGQALTPLEWAIASTTTHFRSSDEVLAACSHYLATDLGANPHVRQALRSQFDVHAVLNTRPTEDGKRVIDAFHSAREVKHLKDKPIVDILKFESPTTKFIKYASFFVHSLC